MQKLRDGGRGSQVTLQQLEYFRVLAKFENINVAAKQIHISQPALSMSIKKLEAELGYRLFDRTGNSIRINYRGEQFLEAVNDIFAVLESFKQRAYLPSEKHYEIWLGMLSSSADVINLCDTYMRKHDKVIIRFLSRRFLDGSPEMNRVDLFIGPQNLRTEGLSSTPLFSFRDYAIIPRAFVPSIPSEITHAELKDMPFAMCCPPDIAQPKTLKGFLDEGYTPNLKFIADSRAVVMSIMKTGKYFTIAPSHDVACYLCMAPNLVAVPIKPSAATGAKAKKVYVSWKDDKLSPQARDFLEFLTTEFKKMKPDHEKQRHFKD